METYICVTSCRVITYMRMPTPARMKLKCMCGPTPATSKFESCHVNACVMSCTWMQMKPVLYDVCVCVCVYVRESVSVREYVLSCSTGIYIYTHLMNSTPATRIYEWVMPHVCTSHVIFKWKWVIWHVCPTPQLLQLTSMHESCHVYAWVTSRIWVIWHIFQTPHVCAWVTSRQRDTPIHLGPSNTYACLWF